MAMVEPISLSLSLSLSPPPCPAEMCLCLKWKTKVERATVVACCLCAPILLFISGGANHCLALTLTHHIHTTNAVQKYPRLALMANGQVKNARKISPSLADELDPFHDIYATRKIQGDKSNSPSVSITGEVLTETWPFVTLVLGQDGLGSTS